MSRARVEVWIERRKWITRCEEDRISECDHLNGHWR
jgi:hypothetical protein